MYLDLDDSLSSHSSEEILHQQQKQQQQFNKLNLYQTDDKCLTIPFSKVPFTPSSYVAGSETYSRKVFVGGLPPDIDEGK